MKKLILPFFFMATFMANAQDPTPKAILQKYIDTIGGEAAIKKITDLTLESEGTVQGQALKMKMVKKSPNKFLVSVTVDGMGEVNRTVFDGTKGRISAMGNDQDIDGEKAKMFGDKADIISELSLLNKPDSLVLKGHELIEGADCYVINIKSGGPSVTEYFDVKSGLLIRQKTSMTTQMGDQTVISDFKNFKAVNGVLFPYLLKQDMGMMTIDFTVTDMKANTGVADDVFKL